MDELKNFETGLKNFTDKCENLNSSSLAYLLTLYGNISVLIDKSMKNYSMKIAYPAQELQFYIHSEIQRRINRGID